MRELSEMEKVEQEYKEKFGHYFPRFASQDYDDDQVMEEMKECIKRGVPLLHEPEKREEGVVY